MAAQSNIKPGIFLFNLLNNLEKIMIFLNRDLYGMQKYITQSFRLLFPQK